MSLKQYLASAVILASAIFAGAGMAAASDGDVGDPLAPDVVDYDIDAHADELLEIDGL